MLVRMIRQIKFTGEKKSRSFLFFHIAICPAFSLAQQKVILYLLSVHRVCREDVTEAEE